MIRSSGVSRSITLLLIALAVTLIAHFLPDAETKTWGDGTNGTGAAPNTVANRNPDSVPVTADEVATGNPLKPPLPAPITTTSAGLTFGYLFGDTNDNSTIAIDRPGSSDPTITFGRGGAATFPVATHTFIESAGDQTDAERDWGNTGTDFNTNANWSAGTGGVAPGVGDVAWFTGAKVTDPNLSASLSIAGFYFSSTTSSGYTISATSPFVFTLQGQTDGTAGTPGTTAETDNTNSAAIRADNTTGINTISAPIILAPASGTTVDVFSGRRWNADNKRRDFRFWRKLDPNPC